MTLSIYILLNEALTYQPFGEITVEELYQLRIVDVFPDDELINPTEISPTVVISDPRFNTIFNEIFEMIPQIRWEAYNKEIPKLLLYIFEVGVKYHNRDKYEGFHLLVRAMKQHIEVTDILAIREWRGDLVTFEDFANVVGFMPPKGFKIQQKVSYVFNGSNTIDNPQFPFEDRVILERASKIGFEFEYTSRSDLRLNFMRWTVDRITGVFIVHPPLFKYSKNKCLPIVLEQLNEVKDGVLIGYGSLDSYTTYHLDEILHCIDVENGKICWPDNIQLKMRKRIVKNIISLLYNTGRQDEGDQLNNKLSEYNEAKADFNRLLSTYKQNFDLLSNDDKSRVISIMINMLMAGMYMRKWRSTAVPYPMTSEAASIEFNPDENVANATLKVTRLLIGSDVEVFINQLPAFCLYYIKNNDIIRAKITIGEMIAKTISGESCIRIYSTLFVTTACVYTKLFTEVDLLPNLKELEYIN